MKNVDYRYAFELLVDRLTKDDVGFNESQCKLIEEISQSCLEDACLEDATYDDAD